MSRTTNLVLGIVLVLVGVLGIAVVSLGGRPGGVSSVCPGGACGRVPVSPPARMSRASGVDAMFIEQMIPHHDDAIAMAELALTRAEHPELKQLAEDVVRTQTAENAQMRAWYGEWFDADIPANAGGSGMMGGGMMGGGMMDGTDLDALEAAPDFDKAFIEQMIPHHEMGIMMSRMAGNATGRDEIRELTDAIIRGQSDEIEKMRTWYQEWYGR